MNFESKLEPISVSFTLKDHIYEVLRTSIMQADIYDSEQDLRLDERKLAEQLGISRTPVREALARLAQDGLVEIIPRKGVFIHRKSMQEILNIIITWAALESMAASMAASNASDADIAALRKFAMSHSATAHKAELSEYSDANIKFHQTILELSGCDLLKSTADQLFVHMYAIRKKAIGEGNRASRSVEDHMEIIRSLEKREAERASMLVREHTMRLHDHIKERWTRLVGHAPVEKSHVEKAPVEKAVGVKKSVRI